MDRENLVLKDCHVYSVRQGAYSRRDIYISQGRILDTQPKNARVVDLNGAYVHSGFVDAHAHLLGTGIKKGSIDLSEARTIECLEHGLRHSAPLLIARGWDDSKLSFTPNRAMLDRITDKPAILYRRCGHVAVINSAALERFSLKDLEGVDGSSLKTGLLRERALNILSSKMSFTRSELQAFIDLGIQEFISKGITTVHSDDMKSFNDEFLLDIFSAQRKLRIFEKVKTEKPDEISLFDLAKEKENHFFTVGALKVYLDGSLGARTAALLEPYDDDPMNCGMLYMDIEQLEDVVEMAENRSIQVCAHTIGDRSMDVALKGFARIMPHNPLKHRLIHVQTANRKQLRQMRKLDLRATIQPLFFFSDKGISLERLGSERLQIAHPYRAIEEEGIRISLSSDSPVESISIFENLSASDKFFSRSNSIKYYTVEGKDLEGTPRYGEISPGCIADLTIVPLNLLEAEREALLSSEVIMTVVAGNVVFER